VQARHPSIGEVLPKGMDPMAPLLLMDIRLPLAAINGSNEQAIITWASSLG
jgi:hypothetical protein